MQIKTRVAPKSSNVAATKATITSANTPHKSKSSRFRRVRLFEIPKAKVHVPTSTLVFDLCASNKYEFPVAFTFNLLLSIQFSMKWCRKEKYPLHRFAFTLQIPHAYKHTRRLCVCVWLQIDDGISKHHILKCLPLLAIVHSTLNPIFKNNVRWSDSDSFIIQIESNSLSCKF